MAQFYRYALKIIANGGHGIDILFDLLNRPHFKLFAFVHAAKTAAVPGAITGESNQQRAASAFTGRPINAGFKAVIFNGGLGHTFSLDFPCATRTLVYQYLLNIFTPSNWLIGL
jgi:hypothetical protein